MIVFCKILLKLDFLSPLLSGCNLHQQSNSPLCAWKFPLTKLFARDAVENDSHLPDVFHLGVLNLHLAKLSLFIMVSLETF